MVEAAVWPFVCSSSPAAMGATCTALAEAVPEWANFQVTQKAEYLGFQMGPSAGATVWSKAMAKFKSRAEMVIHQVAPPPAAVMAWNSLAVHVDPDPGVGVRVVAVLGAAEQAEPLFGDDVRRGLSWCRCPREEGYNVGKS